jgi:hypothetical protein
MLTTLNCQEGEKQLAPQHDESIFHKNREISILTMKKEQQG